MDADEIEKRDAAGFTVGDAADFLVLSPEEVEQMDARETRQIASGGAKNRCGESV